MAFAPPVASPSPGRRTVPPPPTRPSPNPSVVPEWAKPKPKSKTESKLSPLTGFQNTQLNLSLWSAQNKLDRTLRALSRLSDGRGRKHERRAFQALFGPLESERIGEVRSTFLKIRGSIPIVERGTKDDASKSGIQVWVDGGDTGRCAVRGITAWVPRKNKKQINVCPSFFDKSIEFRARVLIHELGHVWGLGNDLYDSARIFPLLANEPIDGVEGASARNNAESFESFVSMRDRELEPEWIDDDGRFVDHFNRWRGARNPDLEDAVRRALAYVEQRLIWTREDLDNDLITLNRGGTLGGRRGAIADVAGIEANEDTNWRTVIESLLPTLELLEGLLARTLTVELSATPRELAPRYYDAANMPGQASEAARPSSKPSQSRLVVGPEFLDLSPAGQISQMLIGLLESFHIDTRRVVAWTQLIGAAGRGHEAELPLVPEPRDPPDSAG